MTAPTVEAALAATQAWLVSQKAPEAALVACLLGRPAADRSSRRWIGRILGEQDEAGSWGGDLLATAEALLTIGELRAAGGLAGLDPGVVRGHDWIRSRRGLPGTWADGCSPERHRNGLCHHFIGGFFSPGPPEPPRPEVRLRCGARVTGDPEVRFVASVLALRCSLQHGPASRDDGLHLDSLRRLVRIWSDRPPPGLATGSLLATVHALLESPADADREAAEQGLRLLAGKQRGDGSWVETDTFQALDMMGAALDAGVAEEPARRALWHATRLLIPAQQKDGSWGPDAGPRRAFIAWRTFRRLGVSAADPSEEEGDDGAARR